MKYTQDKIEERQLRYFGSLYRMEQTGLRGEFRNTILKREIKYGAAEKPEWAIG